MIIGPQSTMFKSLRLTFTTVLVSTKLLRKKLRIKLVEHCEALIDEYAKQKYKTRAYFHINVQILLNIP